MKRTVTLIVLLTLAGLLAGCDVYTAATVKEMDSNASLARTEANKGNQGQLTPEQMAYDLEVFARGFENLSQAGHFKKPLYVGAPTSQPTTLPWTPTGGTNPNP
jgi:hypothetical protein